MATEEKKRTLRCYRGRLVDVWELTFCADNKTLLFQDVCCLYVSLLCSYTVTMLYTILLFGAFHMLSSAFVYRQFAIFSVVSDFCVLLIIYIYSRFLRNQVCGLKRVSMIINIFTFLP